MIAWLGAFLLAFCSVPELFKSIRTKNCSLTWGFLLMWLFGEVFILIPVFEEQLGMFLVFNYGVNISIILILIYFKLRKLLRGKGYGKH